MWQKKLTTHLSNWSDVRVSKKGLKIHLGGLHVVSDSQLADGSHDVSQAEKEKKNCHEMPTFLSDFCEFAQLVTTVI